MVELGINDISQLYDMTFAEFSLRSYGYKRQQQFEWAKFRKVAWASMVGFGLKRPPKNEKKLMSLPMVDGDVAVASEESINHFKELVRQFHAKQNL